MSDDGRGIDFADVKEKAVQRGFIKSEDAVLMQEKDIINLLFSPGFSSAEGGTRTPTSLRTLDPESNASANSATSAYIINLAFLIASSQFHYWYFLLTEYTKARISATTL